MDGRNDPYDRIDSLYVVKGTAQEEYSDDNKVDSPSFCNENEDIPSAATIPGLTNTVYPTHCKHCAMIESVTLKLLTGKGNHKSQK